MLFLAFYSFLLFLYKEWRWSLHLLSNFRRRLFENLLFSKLQSHAESRTLSPKTIVVFFLLLAPLFGTFSKDSRLGISDPPAPPFHQHNTHLVMILTGRRLPS
jgi:hypothetical protein